MSWNLHYLKITDNEKKLEYERNFEDGELDLIDECNRILGDFNSFCDYYAMLDSSLKDLKKFIERVEDLENKLGSPIEIKKIIVEINKWVINFVGMFKNYLDYYEVQVKQVYGDDSKELEEFKNKCSKFYDKYFEYRFLYNLRHFSVHYKLPITKITQNIEDKRRIFYIDKDQLKAWNGWKSTIKQDIRKLEQDIDIKQFILKVEKILRELNKDISYYNTSEVLGAIRIMKKYVKNKETPYIVKENKTNDGNVRFEIKNMIDDYILANKNILDLGIISCSVYNKEYGLQIFDPLDLMFTKEQKEKLGLQ